MGTEDYSPAQRTLIEAIRRIEASQTNERIRSLYHRLDGHPLVRWKESIKRVVGVEDADGADEDWTRSTK